MKQQRETLSFIGRVRSLLSAGPAEPRQVPPPPAYKPVVAANQPQQRRCSDLTHESGHRSVRDHVETLDAS